MQIVAFLFVLHAAGAQELVDAVAAGDVDAVRAALEAGADPNVADGDGVGVLASAARAGHAAIVVELLEAGADVDATTSNEVTPLMYAARRGSPDTVQALIDAGANVSFETRYGGSALRIAVMENHSEVTALLLGAGADATGVEGQETPLTQAIRDQRVSSALALVAGGEEVTAYALVVAARDGSDELVELLELAELDYQKALGALRENAARVVGDVKPPRKIKDVPPRYPSEAKDRGVQGMVALEAIIDVEGNVTDLRILKSIPELDQAAIDAVRQWKYEPTILEGEPVPVVMNVTVSFSLSGTR